MDRPDTPVIEQASKEMHCPSCGMTLHKLRYEHVDVEMCLSCKGIWLDEERLQKLVEDHRFGTQLVDSVLNLFKRKSFWGR